MLTDDLEGEAGWDLAKLTGGSDLGSGVSIRHNCERLC